MINSIKQAIADKLVELYPAANGYTIYDEDIPQNFKKPSFLISLANQDYHKRLSNKFDGVLSFDLAYFSKNAVSELKADCHNVQLMLLRAFDLIDTYWVLNKQAQIIDNVLHLTFDIRYSEIKAEPFTAMQTQDTNTSI